MTPAEAERFFATHGIIVQGLDAQELRRAWLRLARRLHPDHGGSHAAAADLNIAYAVLAAGAPARAEPGQPDFSRDPMRDGVRVWAWAGSGQQPGERPSDRIERFDHSDRNFVRRQMWELSGGSTEEWTIWPFDGRAFLTPLTVYASSACFASMVAAANGFARQGFRRPAAVLATGARTALDGWLIGIDGAPLPRPERIPLAGTPPQDRALMASLRSRVGTRGRFGT